MDPKTQQMLDYYRASFPGMMAAQMGNAPAGTNGQAGGANALSKIMLALMQQKAMQKYKQQYPNNPVMTQGVTPSAPTSAPEPSAADLS